jgi:anaphase-promoting complex subunit 5
MTRFLTPAKIGLLSLIELYTQEIIPTASTIPILSFILNQVLPSTVKIQYRSTSSLESLPFLLDLQAFETLLQGHSALVPGRTLWDQFLKKIWSIDSLHSLHEFFANRTNLLAKTYEENKYDQEMGIPPASEDMVYLSRTSPFGSFVRRSKVEFERLKFSDAVALWIAFAKWRQETQAYYMRRNGQLGRWAGDRVLEEGAQNEWGIDATEILEGVAYGLNITGEEQEGNVSTDDVEKLLEFQVEQMQSEYFDEFSTCVRIVLICCRVWKPDAIRDQRWFSERTREKHFGAKSLPLPHVSCLALVGFVVVSDYFPDF